jgi:ABC-type nitrate/sulfonate/bicarbonate transport system substrate-binding protein
LGALALLAAVAVAACGSSAATSPHDIRNASLILDFTPNAVHAGIYSAIAHHLDRNHGVHLHVVVPSATTDSIKLLETGRVNFAILDIHDLAIARERGADIVGVMALVQKPLAAVLAAPDIKRPRDLEGKRAGVTGLPSDTAVLDSVVRGDHGDPAKVRATTIGFEAVKAMLAGRVSGATAFWNVEGVALAATHRGFHEFRVDDYGAPSYPELVLCVTRATLQDKLPVVKATIRALQRGYTEAQDDPPSAVAAMTTAVHGLDAGALDAQLDAVAPAFTAGAASYGQLQPDVLRAWADWDVRFGILHHPPDLARAFDTSLVPVPPANQ